MKTVLVSCSLVLSILVSACKPPTSTDQTIDRAVIAYISDFSVPDSVKQDSIAVTIKGTIGYTEDYSFDRINVSRTDSIFNIGVWGRQVYKSSINYAYRPVLVDTTLILSTPLHGKYYIELGAQQGVFVDTTFVR